MLSPKRSTITSFDFGPCTCTGPTSISLIVTSCPDLKATPRAHSSTSLSASESQKRFSSRRNRTGSLMIPPSGRQRKTYLHCSTAHLFRSRATSRLVNSKASGPLISI